MEAYGGPRWEIENGAMQRVLEKKKRVLGIAYQLQRWSFAVLIEGNILDILVSLNDE